MVVQLNAGSNLPRPHPTACASLGVLLGKQQNLFSLAFHLQQRMSSVKDTERASVAANCASLTVLGALDQQGEVFGALDGHGMASRGLQSTGWCSVSSGRTARSALNCTDPAASVARSF